MCTYEGPTNASTSTDETARNSRSNIPRHPDETQQKKAENDPNASKSATTTTQPGYTTAPPSNVQRQNSSTSTKSNQNDQQQNSEKKPRNNQSGESVKKEDGEVKSEENERKDNQQQSDNNRVISKPHSDSSGTPHQHTTSAPSTPIRSRNNTLNAEGGSQKNTPTKFNVDQLPSFSLSSQYENISFKLSDDLQQRVVHHQPSFTKSGKSDEIISLVGKIGEEIVYSYFCNLYKEALDTGSVEIQWLNEAEETGQPYDMRIKHLVSGMEDLFIEVKTTVAEEEREFEISSQQLRFAFEKLSLIHI